MFDFGPETKTIETGRGYRIKYQDSKIRVLEIRDYWGSYKEYNDLAEHIKAGYKILSQSEHSFLGDKKITVTLEKPNSEAVE